VSSSRSAVRWDCLLNRLEYVGGRWQFSGNGHLVPRTILPQLLEWIEKGRKKTNQAAANFVRDNSHCLHRIVRKLHEDRFDALQMVNSEGHPIAFCSAVYRIRDEAKLLEVLRRMDEFVVNKTNAGDSATHRFGWVGTEESADGGRPSYGSLAIENNKLRLETNSEDRLQRGRRLLEKNAGDWLKHLEDQVDSFDDMKRRLMSDSSDRPARRVPTKEESEILRRYKQEHYAHWADEPLPALSGRTPREAVHTREGRMEVENLLRLFENEEERERKAGEPAIDFSSLRADLGLGQY
jgi:hypothetical protein